MLGWITVILFVIGGISASTTFFYQMDAKTYNLVWGFAALMGLAGGACITIAGMTGID